MGWVFVTMNGFFAKLWPCSEEVFFMNKRWVYICHSKGELPHHLEHGVFFIIRCIWRRCLFRGILIVVMTLI